MSAWGGGDEGREIVTVQLGALVNVGGVGGHDHLAGLEGQVDEDVVDLLEVEVGHGCGGGGGGGAVVFGEER